MVLQEQLENGELSDGMESQQKKKKSDLENELQLRSAQISDLQTKIMDDDQGISELLIVLYIKVNFW